MTLPDLIANGLAWFLAWLFARAAVHKLTAAGYYGPLIHRYLPAIPAGKAWVLLVAATEAGIALALLLPQSRAGALGAAAMLLLAYAALMAGQILSGRTDMACGCAGPDSSLGVSWALVVRNGICAALALLATTAANAATGGWAGIALSCFVAVFAALVYATCEQIISNAQWMAGEG